MKLKWKVFAEIPVEEIEIEGICESLVSVIYIVHCTN